MHALPRYHPLAHPLSFEAAIRIETRAGGTPTETRISYPLTIGPAQKQGWGSYCLSVDRGPAQHRGYAPNAADEVVELLAQPLHHLEILFDTDGKPQKLRNHAAIWQRWQEETAPAVRSAYAGEWVEQLVVKMEEGLFGAAALLQTLLQRDWILNSYFSMLEWLAGGSESQLSVNISGVEIALPYKMHFAEERGNTILEITAEGFAAGKASTWKKLLPKIQSDGALPVAPRIRKRCKYTLPAGSLWPVGFDCKWEVWAGEHFGKMIYLQLVLL